MILSSDILAIREDAIVVSQDGAKLTPKMAKYASSSGNGPLVSVAGRIAMVSIVGVIGDDCGAIPAGAIEQAIGNLGADKAIRAIVLSIDSPGGSVYGLPELATTIRKVAEAKNVVAVANPMAASAAYYIASQARSIAVPPSGEVGSIGVIAVHMDWSGALNSMGVKPTIVTSSKFKGEFSPLQPLSAEAKEELQRRVDSFDAMFVGDVAKGRNITENKVRATFGQGRMLDAKTAVSVGMADRVATLDQVLAKLGADMGTADRMQAFASSLELSSRL